jgi:hypothetical protein
MSSPPPLTADDLVKRIVRWNFKQCFSGGTLIVCSAFLWLLTIRGTVILVNILRSLSPLSNESDTLSRTLVGTILLFLVWIGCSPRSPLFIQDKPDERFAGIEPMVWKLNDRWTVGFWLAMLGIAPALTLFGIRCFGRCFSLEERRIDLACRTYAVLVERDGWTVYPKLLSQRRAVELLYHLGLIQVSRRFGNLEIHVGG